MNARCRSVRGFTLIELVIVVAIIAALSALAFAYSRWATRNAGVDAASDDLVIRLAGLPGNALSDGRDRVFVLVDRDGSTRTGPRSFVLTAPSAAWKLSSFDPSQPGAQVAGIDEVDLPARVQLRAGSATPAPAPLQAVNLNDAALLTTCGGLSCFAIRYTGDGEVRGEAPAGGDPGVAGFGFVLGDVEDTGATGGPKRRGIVLGFPTGVVKSYVP